MSKPTYIFTSTPTHTHIHRPAAPNSTQTIHLDTFHPRIAATHHAPAQLLSHTHAGARHATSNAAAAAATNSQKSAL